MKSRMRSVVIKDGTYLKMETPASVNVRTVSARLSAVNLVLPIWQAVLRHAGRGEAGVPRVVGVYHGVQGGYVPWWVCSMYQEGAYFAQGASPGGREGRVPSLLGEADALLTLLQKGKAGGPAAPLPRKE